MDTISVSEHECEVDQLPRSIYKGEPTHNLIAPAGHRFDGCGHHCIPCFGLKDVRERAAGESVIACPSDCDCHDD